MRRPSRCCALKAGQTLSQAVTLVPAQPDRVIEGIHAASDALYVMARKGAYSQLLRIPAGTTTVEEVALPFEGHIGEMFADPRSPGRDDPDLELGRAAGRRIAYNAGEQGLHRARRSAPTATSTRRGFTVSDLEAKAHDGVMVPLSLVQPKDAKGPQITIIEAYGSYGISELADFSARRAAAMREGITYGVCHVRGGGELGEAWRLGGKDANKHNTWDDLIACGEDLIARGITTKDKLFIIGGSAGGITMGRALTERPDLFAGVIDLVPAANTLRAEFSPNGPPNIPEFGTVTNEAGFKNLYDMDTIQHVKPGVQYPAVHDHDRPQRSARLAVGAGQGRGRACRPRARTKPVLLRIDEQAGHGIGSTKTQTDQLTADWMSFILWRAGKKEWQPTY